MYRNKSLRIYCPSEGLWRYNFMQLTRIWCCTTSGSSLKFSAKLFSNSSAFSIISTYSPIIQTMDALASGSSNDLRFSQISPNKPSYLFGYFLKMSLITITDYCTTYGTLVLRVSHRHWTHLSAIFYNLIAHLPMVLTAFLTNSTSTSCTHYFKWCNIIKIFSLLAILLKTYSFSIFTYNGSW